MQTAKIFQKTALLLCLCFLTSSCFREDDPGPLQSEERNYSVQNFDRIDMADAFVITVLQSPVYSINVRGDRRNLDDLMVVKNGTTLTIRYDDNRSHEHTTYIVITMPALVGASLGDASNTSISGFKNVASMEMVLSGASIAQLNLESKQATLHLSGASQLTISGKTDVISVKASGASEVFAYGIPATSADVEASGASRVNVYATQSLKVVASGASVVYYKGEPTVSASVSGAGLVVKE